MFIFLRNSMDYRACHQQGWPLTFIAGLLVLMWFPSIYNVDAQFFESYRLVFRHVSDLTSVSSFTSPLNSQAWLALPAHNIAGYIGALSGSPLIGLQLVGLITFAGLWAIVIALIWHQPARTALLSSFALIVLIITNRVSLGLRLHGSELIERFDIEPLFNQCIVFGVILICVYIDKKKFRTTFKVAALLFGLFLLQRADDIYLVELVGLLIGVTFFESPWGRQYFPHYNETTFFKYLGQLILSIALYLVFVRATQANTTLLPNYVAYLFNTLLLITSSVMTGVSLSYLIKRKANNTRDFLYLRGHDNGLSSTVSILTLYIAFTSIVPTNSLFDVRVASKVDQAVLSLQGLSESHESGRNNSILSPVAGLPESVPRLLNYAISTDRSQKLQYDRKDLIGLARNNQFHWLMTDNKHVPFFLNICGSGVAGSLTGFDSDCLNRTFQSQVGCSGSINFTKTGNSDPRFFQGLSEPEDHGRWTDGNKVYFGCIARGSAPKYLVMKARGFVYDTIRTQRVIVRLNGNPPEEFKVSATREIKLKLPTLTDEQVLIVEMDFPDAISPRDLGLSADARRLALTFESAVFSFND